MTTTVVRPLRRYAALIAGLGTAALVAAGCSNGAAGPTGSSGAHDAVTVTTADSPAGTYLTDGAGRTLYLWVADTSSTSTCSGACAAAWPPVTTKGTPIAVGQVEQAKLGTTARDGGKQQVTYAGHPLYYFAVDSHPGATAGQGSDQFGAKWWLVDPTGAAITNGSGAGPQGSAS